MIFSILLHSYQHTYHVCIDAMKVSSVSLHLLTIFKMNNNIRFSGAEAQQSFTFYQYKFFSVTELTLNPPEGIVAGPVNEENFFEWEALIT